MSVEYIVLYEKNNNYDHINYFILFKKYLNNIRFIRNIML